MFEMDSDLVGSSRRRADEEEAKLVVEGRELDIGNGVSPVAQNSHLFSMDGMAPDRGSDVGDGRSPVADGEIELFDSSLRKHLDQLLMSG